MMSSRGTIVALVLLAFVPAQSIRNIKFVSPLQSLTIWDPETKEEASQVGPSPRQRFLLKFQAGLSAEKETERQIEERRKANMDVVASEESGDWAQEAAAADWADAATQDRLMEQAFDQAVGAVDTELDRRHKQQENRRQNSNKYQFVGVVQRPNDPTPVRWYARPKPAGAKWSLRLVHVNREAVVKDLFEHRKVDIYGRYKNTGVLDEKTNKPIIQRQYTVRERSWKNFWNFSPKHFFSDSSGMYWRERRLPPGLYTDGNTVFESSYRYDDGRNGMHKISSFEDYIKSPSIDAEQKESIIERMKSGDPDVVIEQ